MQAFPNAHRLLYEGQSGGTITPTIWKNAFKINSFIKGPSNNIFASSKVLSDKLMNGKKLRDYIHLTRADGDGPINL